MSRRVLVKETKKIKHLTSLTSNFFDRFIYRDINIGIFNET